MPSSPVRQTYAWKATWPDGDVLYALQGIGAASLIRDEDADVEITIVSWGQPWQADVLDRLNEAAQILGEHDEHDLARDVGDLYQRVGAEVIDGAE